MDPFCIKVIGGMATAVLALAYTCGRLYSDYKKSQEARVAEAAEHKKVVVGIFDLLKSRKTG